ncbi:MAG: hypothetical protein Q8R82_22180, partial [Hyphomonadaceae bacterium]|nr:hypothetical protein [Hyphomonadaceae bacterium]
LRAYLVDLFRRGEPLPVRGRGLDWPAIAAAAGVESLVLPQAREVIRPGLEALRRELNKPPARPRRAPPHAGHVPVPPVPGRQTPAKLAQRRAAQAVAMLEALPDPGDTWRDTPIFCEALDLHMRRHYDSAPQLREALSAQGVTIEASTLRAWRHGRKAPSHVDSFTVLRCLEQRWRLPAGYFKDKLPHPGRAAKGLQAGGVGDAERRRLAWHLPDDFDRRSLAEREEILEWVRRVVVSGSTEYRRYQAAALKHRFGVRFPMVRLDQSAREHAPYTPGAVHAPPALAAEMADLISFKTATLTALGYRRRGVWGEETAAQRMEHFGLLFGALSADPAGPVRGHGLPLETLTFGLLAFPRPWDWYLNWRETRRGFYTAWEADMLGIAAALTAPQTGWLTQSPQLAERLGPVDGLLSAGEIDGARRDWAGVCAELHAFAMARSKEIARASRVHHDPFEPILPVLEADSPVGEYRKIADEILKRRPVASRYPKAAAENARAFLMIRFGLHLGFRQKNLRQLLLSRRDQPPRTERKLIQAKCGELRWSERDQAWEVFVPSVAFKNAGSAFFSGRPFRLPLPDIAGLYEEIDSYIGRHRALLLGPAQDPGTFFVKTVKSSSGSAAYDQTTFYEAWRWIIQRYGIYNPWTGRGAIAGLLPHGPHNVRDVLATHILKQTGSYEQASYAIQDTPDTVAAHYGRFLPQDKAALAAQVLNRAWETA